MSQEDKQLLFKDLSARLPYRVKCTTKSMWNGVYTIVSYKDNRFFLDCPIYNEGDDEWMIESIVPYLRPISSMTEEEFVYFMGLRGRNFSHHDICQMMKETFNNPNYMTIVTQLYCYLHKMDWLFSKHFDVRGLIERSLAIAVTEENNPYKE